MNIFILGANGFIGSHLCEAILAETDWVITAIDLGQDKLIPHLTHPRFTLQVADINTANRWINNKIKWADVILPLAAIATPATYVRNPLAIFELDFEVNLRIIRQCVKYHKRVVFPSTSEVYGMCPDTTFDEIASNCVTGPIHKERWIYATSKQLLDRLIYAYGHHQQLDYTLFRPFNWYGPGLDNLHNPHPGASRVLTQFIGNFIRGENIQLVNGGQQQRCFTYISDGIAALLTILANQNKCAHQGIFNIGNPHANISIRQLAEKLKILITQCYPDYAARAQAVQFIDIHEQQYYGSGYQDVSKRIPQIQRAQTQLNFSTGVDLETGLKKTLDFYLTG